MDIFNDSLTDTPTDLRYIAEIIGKVFEFIGNGLVLGSNISTILPMITSLIMGVR